MELKENEKIIRNGLLEIRYTHLTMDSKRVCFMFSGVGYTYDSPLFYYATMIMLQHHIEVVQVHYPYEDAFFMQPIDKIAPALIQAVHPVVSEVLSERHDVQTLFLGKSIGTLPIVNDFMHDDAFLKSKMILLTPLLKNETVYQTLLRSGHQGLLVIGDQDRHFDPEKIIKLEKTKFDIEVVAQGNHALDVGEFDAVGSIRAHEQVIQRMEKMVQIN